MKHNLSKATYALLFLLSAFNAYGMEWIEEGIDLTINNQFDDAQEYFLQKISESPQDYRTYFYYAATLNSKMTHFENNLDEQAMEWALNRTITMIDSLLKISEDIPDSIKAQYLFYLGSAYGYRAFFQGQNKRWFKALSNGMKSSSLLRESVETDSTLYDAYLGIGVYKYWRHSVTRYVDWLPFISDERDEGIRMIKMAIEKSRYSRYIAIQQLIYILVHYSRIDETIRYADQIIKNYPDSQFMLWAAAHAYYKNGELTDALHVYQHLVNIILHDPQHNPHHLLKCKLKLAEIYFDLGQYENCITECEQLRLFLDQNQKDVRQRVENLIEKCRQMAPESHTHGRGGLY